MRIFLKIFLTAAISLNLLGAVMPPKTCGMPCCQLKDKGAGIKAACGDCSPLLVYAPETPPCCKIQAAQDIDPATLNSLAASQPSMHFVPVSGPAFAVNTFAKKAPIITGSPPGALESVPVYKLTSAYIC